MCMCMYMCMCMRARARARAYKRGVCVVYERVCDGDAVRTTVFVFDRSSLTTIKDVRCYRLF